jgi:hypothetical protein
MWKDVELCLQHGRAGRDATVDEERLCVLLNRASLNFNQDMFLRLFEAAHPLKQEV